MKHLSHPAWLGVFITSLFLLAGIGTFFVIDVSMVESWQTFGTPFALAKQQLIGLLAGVLLFGVGVLIPTRWWIKLAPYLYGLGIILLIAVFLPGIGLSLNGASRWIHVGSFVFQPVEFMKFALILFFSTWLVKHQRLAPFLLFLALPLGLILLQPDVGSLLVLSCIAVCIYFLAGARFKVLLWLGLATLPLLAIIAVAAPYRFARLTSFLQPSSDPYGASFHIRQITLALGRGGLLGQGIGNSLQKYRYIPEASTDSIFAIIGEEIGFIGSVLLLLLFVCFVYAGQKVILDYPLSTVETLIGLGLLSWIAIQALMNIAAVVGLIPLTGIPLPFMSYGRSAQLMLFLSSGMIVRMGIKQT